jgi:hypothetical protein
LPTVIHNDLRLSWNNARRWDEPREGRLGLITPTLLELLAVDPHVRHEGVAGEEGLGTVIALVHRVV